MHTDPDTIDVISRYGVYHNSTYHVDKYEVHNSDLILRIIQYIVPISNTYSQLDSLVSNDELHIMHTETRMSARSNFGTALQTGSWEQWGKEAGKIPSHNSKVGRCQYKSNFEDNSCNIQCHHKKSGPKNFSFMLFQIFTDPRKLCATFTGQVPNYWKWNTQYYSFELSLNNCQFGKRCFNYRQYLKTTGLRIKIIIWHCTPAHYDCVTPFNPRVIFATNLYFQKEAEMKPVQIITTRRRETKVTALQ
jgi:hypothetical protein